MSGEKRFLVAFQLLIMHGSVMIDARVRGCFCRCCENAAEEREREEPKIFSHPTRSARPNLQSAAVPSGRSRVM